MKVHNVSWLKDCFVKIGREGILFVLENKLFSCAIFIIFLALSNTLVTGSGCIHALIILFCAMISAVLLLKEKVVAVLFIGSVFSLVFSCLSFPPSEDGYLVIKGSEKFSGILTISNSSHRDAFGLLEAQLGGTRVTQFAIFVLPFQTRVWRVGDYEYADVLKVEFPSVIFSQKPFILQWDTSVRLLPSRNPQHIVVAASFFKTKKEWDMKIDSILKRYVQAYSTQESFAYRIGTRFLIPLTMEEYKQFQVMGYEASSHILARNMRRPSNN